MAEMYVLKNTEIYLTLLFLHCCVFSTKTITRLGLDECRVSKGHLKQELSILQKKLLARAWFGMVSIWGWNKK